MNGARCCPEGDFSIVVVDRPAVDTGRKVALTRVGNRYLRLRCAFIEL